MGLKHKLKRLSKQVNVLSVQTQATIEGIAQVRRLMEQQNQAAQRQTVLLEKLSQKVDRLLEQHPVERHSQGSELAANPIQALSEQYTAVTRYQAELVRLQAENISRLLTLIDQQTKQ